MASSWNNKPVNNKKAYPTRVIVDEVAPGQQEKTVQAADVQQQAQEAKDKMAPILRVVSQ